MSSHIILVSLQISILLIGLGIVLITLISYFRSRKPFMLFISIGYTAYIIGVLIEGIIYEFLLKNYLTAQMIGSIFIAIGLGAILYGIYRRD